MIKEIVKQLSTPHGELETERKFGAEVAGQAAFNSTR